MRACTQECTPGITLALKLVNNILSHPDDPKYRKLKCSSQALQKLVGLDGGNELLAAFGFETDADELTLPPTVAPAVLLQSKRCLEGALASRGGDQAPQPE